MNELRKKIIYLAVTIMLLVVFGLMCYNHVRISRMKEILVIDNLSLEVQNLNLKTQLKKMQDDHDELKLQFDTFKDLTSDEFERTWRSFGAVRRNFIALGTSACLENDDLAPERYWEDSDEYEDDEDDERNDQ